MVRGKEKMLVTSGAIQGCHDPTVNPLPDMPVLSSSNSIVNRYDVKNIDKWGYCYLI